MTARRLLGAHMSIAGGLPLAVARGAALDCTAIQIFTKNSNQWRARALPDQEVVQFQAAARQSGIWPVAAHDSYLINCASPDRELRAQSLAALGEEIDRAEQLELPYLVMHPGTCTRGTPEAEGLRLIADAVLSRYAARRDIRLAILFEHTAGQGNALGHRFEHLARLLELLGKEVAAGVCLDTCHLLAAGYDLRDEAGYKRTFDEFDRVVGLSAIRLFHLNDSKRPLGSRVDRHAHIGQGEIGLHGFRLLLNDPRFAGVPMLLETPKDTDGGDTLDRMNLNTLRGLIRPQSSALSPES